MSRKFIITIVLILFLLPFVSWYYLQSGLDWRKTAQDVMNGTTPFPEGEYKDIEGDVFNADSLAYRVSIVSFASCDDSDKDRVKVLEDVYNQFKDTKKANYIVLDSCAASSSEKAINERDKWYHISCDQSGTLCDRLMQDWPFDRTFALIDRNGVIRSYYAIHTEDERRLLVEHMSLLLPRERQEQVELKRGDKK